MWLSQKGTWKQGTRHSSLFYLGAVHKGRPHSGGRGFVECGHFADKERGVLQMRTSALFDAKNFGFLEILSVKYTIQSRK